MSKPTKTIVALAILAVSSITMVLLGIVFLVTPARSEVSLQWCEIGARVELPADGSPVSKDVWRPRRDAWMRLPDEYVGTVFLRVDSRTSKVTALLAIAHGSSVDYDDTARRYIAWCTNTAFDLEGNELIADCNEATGYRMVRLPIREDNGRLFVRLD